MRILKQIIEKKIDNEKFLIKCNQEELAYQEHISAYLLSLFYLNTSDKNIDEKQKLWKKFVFTKNKRFFLRLIAYKPEENNIIMMALKRIDFKKQEESQRWGSLYGDFGWAILSYEHEENE